MINAEGEVRFSGLERHLATVLLAIAVAFLGWIGVKSSETAERLARVEGRLEDMDSLQQRINDHEQRLRAIERGHL